MDQTGSSRPSVTRGEPDAVKAARPVREGGPGKRTRGNSDTAPGADPHWLHGGRTDIHNLALLCDFHHRLIHDHGYRMRGFGNDVTFHRPDGRLIPNAGPPTEGRTQSLYDVSAAQGTTITDETITPTWAGERLDPTPILALLLPERTMAAA